MSGILRLESLTKGNTLRQGDLTLLKYRLFDADGDKLDISGKPATVRLMKNDFTFIAYEKEGLTVAQDDTISFSINKILPGGLYHLEVIVDDKYIFPSRADEGKFNVDKSSLGAELTIIENAGIDAVVRKAVDLINDDPNLIIDEDKLVNDIISNTGIGSINDYYQAFDDLKPKAELSISQSAEALTKSQNALNVANGIDAKATNALSLSESADTLSKSVQDQFNQVVIDGDSSVEAAQARVDASGQINPTLKARLDKEYNEVTTRLSQVNQQISQQQEGDLINLLRKHSMLGESIYVRRSGTTLIIAVFFDTENAVEYHMRVDNDGWWRKREAFVRKFKKKEINGSINLHTDMDNFTESDWLGSSPTRYTTTVGAEFSGTFEGSGLFFNSTTDKRGGVWEFTIDGIYKRLISTWSEDYVWTRAHVVIDGLEYGEHTYTAKFIGEDPVREYTEAARGWANYNPNYPTSSTLKTVSPIVPTLEEVGVGFEIGDSVSIDEFAFSVKPASASYDSDWVPAHSGKSGIMKDVEKNILIDGEDIINDIMSYPTIYRPARSVRFIANYKAYHLNNTSPLWEGRIDQYINPNGFFVTGKMKFLQNTRIENGYTAMYPSKRSTTGVDTLVTSKGLRRSFGGVGTETVIPNYPSEVVLFSQNGNESQRKLAIGLGIYDSARSLNSNHWGSKQFVSHRGDDTDKLYFRPYQGVNATEGEVYNFNTELFITQIEEVSDILS